MQSLPSWERGLKPEPSVEFRENDQSLPSWERGLKQTIGLIISAAVQSLPSWERGLKLYILEELHQLRFSRSLRGSVD